MKRCEKLAAGACLFAVLLSGCGKAALPAEITVPTLVISGEGKVTAYLVGEFDKSYYDLSELKAMAEEEAAQYGAGSNKGMVPVSVESVEASPDGSGKIILAYGFDGTDSYKGFMKNELFYGTVEEAIAQGYVPDEFLRGTGSGAPMSVENLKKEKGRHLVVTDAKAVIYCPNKVTHMSMGVVLKEDGSVDTSQTEGLVYILLKK